jgi:hypothetical protein
MSGSRGLAELPENKCNVPRYSPGSLYIQAITACPGLLSVTESVCAPASTKGGQMPKSSLFNFREWLVPPVLLPIFLVLLIAGAMFYNASPA